MGPGGWCGMSGENEALDVNEQERRSSLRILNDMIGDFLEGRYFEITLVFDRPLELHENEFWDLLGYYDSSNGGEGFDEYEYDAGVIEDARGKCFRVKKYLYIYYNVKDLGTTYIIHKVEGTTEYNEESCEG
jgi:hypothetical protein